MEPSAAWKADLVRGLRYLTVAGCSSRALADQWFAQWPVPVWVLLRPRLKTALNDPAAMLAEAHAQIRSEAQLSLAVSARAALISLRMDLVRAQPLELRVCSFLRLNLQGSFGNRPYNTVNWRADSQR